MAIVQNPITGRTRKKFANAVFAKSYTQNVMRSKALQVSNPNTEDQQKQRSKFAIMVAFSQILLGFISQTMKGLYVNMSAYNAFMKANIKTCFTGVFPNFEIDYSLVKTSVGPLLPFEDPGLAMTAGHIVTLTWDDNTGQGNASSTDKLLCLIYNKDKNSISTSMSIAQRDDATLAVTVPASWVGDDVEVYGSFQTETKDKISNSQYFGTGTILA